MRAFIITFLALFLISNVHAATPDLNMIHSAKAVMAILGKGNFLPKIVDVLAVEQESIPPKSCILVVFDRRPNTDCPDEYGQGPFLDKGFAACFSPTTDEVDSVLAVSSMCPPKN